MHGWDNLRRSQDGHIHLILLFPTGQFCTSQFEDILKYHIDPTAETIATLKQDHLELFELLQLTVKKLGIWAKEDIEWNDAEWMRIQNNTSLSTEQPAPATNSSIVFTEVDQIPMSYA